MAHVILQWGVCLYRKWKLTAVCPTLSTLKPNSLLSAWCYPHMAVLMSARVSHIRALPCSALSLIRADFQTSGVKFRHLLPPGSPQLRGTGVTSPVRSHINAAVRGDRFSTTAAALRKSSQANGSSSPRGRRGWLGKFALGAALGVGTGALVQALHTGVLTAMPLKMNLDSAESDWKEAKGENVQQWQGIILQDFTEFSDKNTYCQLVQKVVISFW